ncbi:MAG TPA: OmpA family protein [Bacteroidales bacterium]|nr:OmpA family protein [Bacteroidales bacterium]HSA42222.1 OmpA family protein [Bacteroidales bacterium]
MSRDETYRFFRALLLVHLWLLILPALKAQEKNTEFIKQNFPKEKHELLKDALRNIKEGDLYYQYGNRATYLQALDYYLKANDFNPNNDDLNYKIGKCYLVSLEKSKAVFFLEKAARINPGIAPDIQYLLGQAYHFNQMIDQAGRAYTTYLSGISGKGNEQAVKEVQKKLKECEVARKLMGNAEKVTIENLGSNINTKYPEYALVITADESKLLFTSSRDNTVGGDIDPIDLYYYEDIYISPRISDQEWSVPLHPGKPLNTEYHDATVGLTPDGQKLLMYRGDNGGDLYESQLKGEEYGNPVKLPRPVNSKYHEPSACYSPDQQTLYFVSDRPDGYGGHDIYSCSIKDGRFGDAVNLGPVINTEYDETGVFMHPDGKTLYFSSQGHPTMGGFDIFYSVLEQGVWSEPRNLGFPVNTTDDDVFIVLSADGRRGYLASYRPGGYGEKDIYRVTFHGPEKPLVDNTEDNLLASIIEPFRQAVMAPVAESRTSQLTLLKGTVYDAVTLEPLGAAIDITDNSIGEVVSSFESNMVSGKYLIALPSGKNYGIAVRADAYLFHSENFDIPQSRGYQEVEKDVYLNVIEVGKKIVLRNIFFDFDRYTLRPESRAELNRLLELLKQMPRLKVEISGHTDSFGSESYNQVLSENRAKAVVEFLVAAGIDKTRLIYKGYGLTQPIASNATDEGRQLNRRTEFKILAK